MMSCFGKINVVHYRSDEKSQFETGFYFFNGLFILVGQEARHRNTQLL